MKTISLLIFLVLISSAFGHSQNQDGQNQDGFYLKLGKTADKLKADNPTILSKTLDEDIAVIYESLKEIKSALEIAEEPLVGMRVFGVRRSRESEKPPITSADLDNLVLNGWEQLRSQRFKPNEKITSKIYVAYVTSLGKLVIGSVPDGATVEIDNKKLPDPTLAIVWLSPGKYTVRICKPEYNCMVETCEINEGRITRIERELSKIKQATEKAPSGSRRKPNK